MAIILSSHHFFSHTHTHIEVTLWRRLQSAKEVWPTTELMRTIYSRVSGEHSELLLFLCSLVLKKCKPTIRGHKHSHRGDNNDSRSEKRVRLASREMGHVVISSVETHLHSPYPSTLAPTSYNHATLLKHREIDLLRCRAAD